MLVLNMDCLDTHMLISISEFSYRSYSRSTPCHMLQKLQWDRRILSLLSRDLHSSRGDGLTYMLKSRA